MKNVALFFGSLLLVYLFAEVLYSALVVNQVIKKRTFYFTEAIDPNGHIHFDSKIGYKMSQMPARYGSVVSDGRLQSMGILIGNNYGCPDKRTFLPEQTNSTITRIAVLGDSFTASQFTSKSWLKCFEDSLNVVRTDSIELLNFAIDGGGLANWLGLLKEIVIKDSFDIDGIIYAICGDDLDRKFHTRHEFLAEEAGNLVGIRAVGVGYHLNWMDELHLKTVEDAGMWFSDGWKVLSPQEIDLIESGEWKAQLPWKPYFLEDLSLLALDGLEAFSTPANADQPDINKPTRDFVIERIAQTHQIIDVPTLCLSLCATPEQVEDAKNFARSIGATHIEESIPNEEEATWYIEGDGHWTLKGAQAFAERNHPQIAEWINSSLRSND